jgi:hypothetical protein
MTNLDLPLLSVAKLRHGNKRMRDEELRKLKEAAQIIGFGLLTDCDEDVSTLLVDDLYQKWAQVRALPKDLLNEITLNRSVDGSNRGLEGVGAQSLDPNSRKAGAIITSLIVAPKIGIRFSTLSSQDQRRSGQTYSTRRINGPRCRVSERWRSRIFEETGILRRRYSAQSRMRSRCR